MTINETPCSKIIAGFCVIFCFSYWLRVLRTSLKVSFEIFTFPENLPSSKKIVPSAIGKMECFTMYGFLTRVNSTAYNALPRKVIRRNRMIFHHGVKRNCWSFEWFSESHTVSSHQTRDLECFADSSNIPWNLPTNFHSDLIATIPQRCLPLLCARLFHQSHLFLICVVLTYNDFPGKIFTSLAKFQGIVFRLPVRLQELLQAPLCSLRSFCFARIRLDPLSSQILYHDCISMIVSRFSFLLEDLVSC